jgi:hypothetical protein
MIHPHVFQKLSVGIPMMDRFVGPAHKVSREMANFVNEMLAVKIHAMLESIVMIPILRPSLDVDRALKDTGGMASHVSQQLVNRDLHLVSRFEKKPIFKYFGVGLQKLGGLGTLVWPPKGSQQTVLKG